MDLKLAALDAAHIQDIVDQSKQMVAGGENLLQAFPHLFRALHMACRNGGKPDNGVHGRAYVVAHV